MVQCHLCAAFYCLRKAREDDKRESFFFYRGSLGPVLLIDSDTNGWLNQLCLCPQFTGCTDLGAEFSNLTLLSLEETVLPRKTAEAVISLCAPKQHLTSVIIITVMTKSP